MFVLTVFDLAAAEGLRQSLEPFAASVRDLGTPAFVLKYFHGINMAIVLFAMGYYGCGYLGWTINLSSVLSHPISNSVMNDGHRIGTLKSKLGICIRNWRLE